MSNSTALTEHLPNELIPRSVQDRLNRRSFRIFSSLTSHFIGSQPKFFELRLVEKENVVSMQEFTGSIDRERSWSGTYY